MDITMTASDTGSKSAGARAAASEKHGTRAPKQEKENGPKVEGEVVAPKEKKEIPFRAVILGLSGLTFLCVLATLIVTITRSPTVDTKPIENALAANTGAIKSLHQDNVALKTDVVSAIKDGTSSEATTVASVTGKAIGDSLGDKLQGYFTNQSATNARMVQDMKARDDAVLAKASSENSSVTAAVQALGDKMDKLQTKIDEKPAVTAVTPILTAPTPTIEKPTSTSLSVTQVSNHKTWKTRISHDGRWLITTIAPGEYSRRYNKSELDGGMPQFKLLSPIKALVWYDDGYLFGHRWTKVIDIDVGTVTNFQGAKSAVFYSETDPFEIYEPNTNH